jgi:hypothetical protein
MSSTQGVAQAGQSDSQPGRRLTAAERHADAGRLEERHSERLRIIEDHNVGPNGDDESEAVDDGGRRWLIRGRSLAAPATSWVAGALGHRGRSPARSLVVTQ